MFFHKPGWLAHLELCDFCCWEHGREAGSNHAETLTFTFYFGRLWLILLCILVLSDDLSNASLVAGTNVVY